MSYDAFCSSCFATFCVLVRFSFLSLILLLSLFIFFFFFFNDTATTEIYTLSLHDALPICGSLELVELVGELMGLHHHDRQGELQPDALLEEPRAQQQQRAQDDDRRRLQIGRAHV